MAAIDFLGHAVCEIMIYPPTTVDLCFDSREVVELTWFSLVCRMVKLMEAWRNYFVLVQCFVPFLLAPDNFVCLVLFIESHLYFSSQSWYLCQNAKQNEHRRSIAVLLRWNTSYRTIISDPKYFSVAQVTV